MNIRRLLIVPFLASVLLGTVALSFTAAVTAQDKEQTTTDGSKTTTTPTGFPTGSKCTKTGTYKAENKFLKVVIVMGEGEEFPPFADGEPTTWYALTPSTKSTFEAVKVTSTDPK